MVDPLLPWAPFFYSFGPGLFVIKILADWLKVRLYFPLRGVRIPSHAPFMNTHTKIILTSYVGTG